jgi:transcriptional regulator with XRE-family HTH domain
MRTLDQIIAELPPERRAKVTARTKQLIAEEKALRHLRQARSFTQQSMATLLNIDQASVSKIENRSDMLLSTLRSYVEAMGGSLRLVAEFPDGVTEVSSLSSTDARHPISKAKERGKPQLIEASD